MEQEITRQNIFFLKIIFDDGISFIIFIIIIKWLRAKENFIKFERLQVRNRRIVCGNESGRE